VHVHRRLHTVGDPLLGHSDTDMHDAVERLHRLGCCRRLPVESDV
jgi:hypothetical protein